MSWTSWGKVQAVLFRPMEVNTKDIGTKTKLKAEADWFSQTAATTKANFCRGDSMDTVPLQTQLTQSTKVFGKMVSSQVREVKLGMMELLLKESLAKEKK